MKSASGDPTSGEQPLDKRWIIALVAGLAILLLLLMFCVAAGLGLAVASGMFSSGSGYESSSGGNETAGNAAASNATDSQTNSGSSDSPDDAESDSGAAPSDDDTEMPADESGDSSNSASGGSSGGASSGSKVYAIPGGQFFGLETDGQSFVYVVDCSGSMSGAPFRRARDEIIRSVASLTADQSFFVVFFSDDELPMFSPSVTSSLIPATPANIDRVREWVQGIQSDGGTNPMTALHRALQLRPDAVYLLTDGELEGDVMSLVTNSNPTGVRINTVCFMNRSGEPLLKQIAGKTGGVHLFVP